MPSVRSPRSSTPLLSHSRRQRSAIAPGSYARACNLLPYSDASLAPLDASLAPNFKSLFLIPMT